MWYAAKVVTITMTTATANSTNYQRRPEVAGRLVGIDQLKHHPVFETATSARPAAAAFRCFLDRGPREWVCRERFQHACPHP